jgi:hypothetical protein
MVTMSSRPALGCAALCTAPQGPHFSSRLYQPLVIWSERPCPFFFPTGCLEETRPLSQGVQAGRRHSEYAI